MISWKLKFTTNRGEPSQNFLESLNWIFFQIISLPPSLFRLLLSEITIMKEDNKSAAAAASAAEVTGGPLLSNMSNCQVI